MRRKAGSGSSGDVLMPCFLTIAKISLALVGEKDKSVEGERGGEKDADKGVTEEEGVEDGDGEERDDREEGVGEEEEEEGV